MPPTTTLREISPPVSVLADETGGEWTASLKLPSYALRHERGKVNAFRVATHVLQGGLPHAGLRPQAQRMLRCATRPVFHFYPESDDTRLAESQTCQLHLLCQFCAIRRGYRMLAAYVPRAEEVMRIRPGIVPYLVTLTVVNGPDLRERFDHLADSLRVLRKRVARGNAESEFAKALAAVWSVEVIKGSGSGLWHPHVHAIWMCAEAPDAARLSEQWKAITGDSHIVDVRPVAEPYAKSFAEVFKYAVKFSELDIADRLEAYSALRGRRMIASSGLFRGLEVGDESRDELLPDDHFLELLLRWVPAEEQYELHRVVEHDEPRGCGAGQGPAQAAAGP